ncbi:efflux transporter outer membrane subunit [Allopusillimonas ginsengisoli]|uniref:efflux transporter outer membrane subunit n=1 Tax=Allopusillimonas ginsengisoli TaxID=453575 RepID=UPI0039C12FE8
MIRSLHIAVRLAVFGAVTLAAGCAFGPGNTLPEVAQPHQYGAVTSPEHTVQAQGVSQHLQPAQLPQPYWWRAYGSDALNQLVDEALANNLDLKTASQRLAAAREQWAAQTGATTLPSIGVGGDAARQRALGLPFPGTPNTSLYNTFVGQAEVRYTFDLFGAIRYDNEALGERVDQQAYQLQAARNAVAANVVSGAITLAGTQAQIREMKRIIELSDHDARDRARQVELGAASRTALLDAQRTAASLAAQLPELQTRARASRHALAVLLGRTPDLAPFDIGFEQLSVPETVPVVVPSALLQSRPDIAAAGAALRAASADVGLATANMFPRLSLSASMGQAGYDWSTALSGAGAIWSAAASLTAPLFQGSALRAQRRAALQSYEAAVSSYRQTVLSAFQEVADALAALEHGNQSLAAADTAWRAAQAQYESTDMQVQLGAVPPYVARATAQQASQARQEALRFATTRLLDTARLFHAMGGLDDAHDDIQQLPVAESSQ